MSARDMTAPLDAALDYATRTWHVFPCAPLTKEPAIKNGFYGGTTNPETIKRYWRQSDCNVAIRTGVASGIWVFDIDGETGEASLRHLEAIHGQLPPTLEVITVRGGRHNYFKHPGGLIPCSTGKIGPGLDVRGDGGYIVAPPSVWKNGRRYEWSVDSIVEPACAPEWLVELARKRPAPSISERALAAIRAARPPGEFSDAYGRAALEYEIAALASTPPGSRNHALNRAAFSLFQLVAGGELDEQEVTTRLIEAAHVNGLMTDPDDGPRKVWATIQSGRRAGFQYPRSRPGAA